MAATNSSSCSFGHIPWKWLLPKTESNCGPRMKKAPRFNPQSCNTSDASAETSTRALACPGILRRERCIRKIVDSGSTRWACTAKHNTYMRKAAKAYPRMLSMLRLKPCKFLNKLNVGGASRYLVYYKRNSSRNNARLCSPVLTANLGIAWTDSAFGPFKRSCYGDVLLPASTRHSEEDRRSNSSLIAVWA